MATKKVKEKKDEKGLDNKDVKDNKNAKKGSKKIAESKVNDSSKKAKAKENGPYTLVVPQGGQIIQEFELTPSLPVNGVAANWLFTLPNKTDDIDELVVTFNKNSTELQQTYERAIVVINLIQPYPKQGTWRFVLDGFAVDVGSNYSDANHDIEVSISSNSLQLVAEIQVIGASRETVRFGYVASFTDATSGQVSVYESSDPGIAPVRPK